jgi:HK97 family phage portal protein
LRLLGFDITRAKAPANLQSPSDRGWFPLVREPFTGAWQRNKEVRYDTVLTYHAVYACVTLIATDVAKCRLKLVELDDDNIWSETETAAFSPVIRKPNRYQNRIKFFEQWVVSKLLHGNTYVLKERDRRGVVVALYILDPTRTKVLVADNGDVYYRLSKDNLSDIEDDTIVPASEIIHDVMVPLYHPLCGVSPLTACGIAACQGLSIQSNSANFFEKGANPSGILTAPGTIDNELAERMKNDWNQRFSGENAGRVAVLGNGLQYEQMSVNAVDAQLIEQLKWTAEVVCSAFHMPAYKVGVGAAPAYNNINALDQQYYSNCLQKFFENIELCLDEGLGLDQVTDTTYGTEFDLDDLLRMDTATLIEAETKATGAGIKTIDEARARIGLGPTPGGAAAYLQQQNYSLPALAKRDASEDPFGKAQPVKPETVPNIDPSKAIAPFRTKKAA